MKKILFFCLIVACFFGCTKRIGDLTVATTKNLNLESMVIDYNKASKNCEGGDCKIVILGIPIGYPNMEEALDKAMAKCDGNLMTDIALYKTEWSIILFGGNCIRVKGTSLNTREKVGK